MIAREETDDIVFSDADIVFEGTGQLIHIRFQLRVRYAQSARAVDKCDAIWRSLRGIIGACWPIEHKGVDVHIGYIFDVRVSRGNNVFRVDNGFHDFVKEDGEEREEAYPG
jgi:hypothetical protein